MFYLDHIVHFVDRPEVAMERLIEQGLHVVNGGRHEQWGTYNTLCYFDLTYIELIGIYDEGKFELAVKEPYTLHETYEKNHRQNGFLRIALRTSTIEEDAKAFHKAGFEVFGPERFSRKRPDGSVVSWQLLHIGKQNSEMDYPFFIQWDLTDEERLQEMKELGILAKHDEGDLQIAEVSYLVANLKPAYELQKLLQLPSTTNIFEESNVEIYRIHTPTGDIAFYKPIGDGESWDAFLDLNMGLHTVVLKGATKEKYVAFENANYVFISSTL